MKTLRLLEFNKRGMLLLFAGVLLLLVAPCHAHRVNVFAWVEGDTVHTESSFAGGREVNSGSISVYDDQTGEKLLDGQTDDNGKFSFRLPRHTPLRIEMVAGMGHKNEWIIPLSEITAAGGSAAASPEEAPGAEKKAPLPQTVAESPAKVDAVQIEKTVETVLDRKLSPVVRMLAESRQHRTTLQDVIGGIGYIIGLAGLGAYIHYRRKIKELNRS
jgi:nickel transport protein